MTTWSVLATGPSLRRVRQTDLALGPVVALNLAVLAPLRVDFWCAADNPKSFEQVWGAMPHQARSTLPVMLCREDQAKLWQEIGVRCWPFAAEPLAFVRENLGVHREWACFHLTIIMALIRVAGLGASKIEVWGCDMAGTEHAYGRDPIERAAPLWHGRWAQEAEALADTIELIESSTGCHVSLRQPPG